MRLINADALIKSLNKKHEHFCELCGDEHKDINYAHDYAVMAISDAPTIELKELVTTCGDDCDGYFDKGGKRMKMCGNCKHWIQMKELEGKCVLYGLKHCAWSPAEAWCDEWESDEDE